MKDTIIGKVMNTLCSKCGLEFIYIHRGKKRRVCNACRADKEVRGYGSKDIEEDW